jgi:WD40 repeat protein
MRNTSIGITVTGLTFIGLMLGTMPSAVMAQAKYSLTTVSTLTPAVPNAACLGWAFDDAGPKPVDAIVVGDLTGQIRVFRKPGAGDYLLEPPMQDLARHPTFSDHADALLSLRVFAPGSPGRFFVIAGGVGQSARVWSLASKSLTVELTSGDPVQALAIDSASDWAAAAMANRLNVWSGLSSFNNTAKPAPLGPVTDPAKTDPKNKIAIKSLMWRNGVSRALPMAELADGSIALWPDVAEKTSPLRIEPPTSGGAVTIWSRPNPPPAQNSVERLTSISVDGILREWDANGFPPGITNSSSLPKQPAAFAFSDDGKCLAVAENKTVTVWSGWDAAPITLTPIQTPIKAPQQTSDPQIAQIKLVAIDRQGQNVGAADASGHLWLAPADPNSQPVLVNPAPAPPPALPDITLLALSSDAKRMASLSSDKMIHVYDTTNTAVKPPPFSPNQPPTCLAFFQASGTHWLASAGASRIDLWKVESLDDITNIPGPVSLPLPQGVLGHISAIDFAGDWSGAAAEPGKFKFLIVGTDAGSILVSRWQLDAAPWNDTSPAWPKTVLTLQMPGKKIVSVRMRAATNQLISVADDSAVHLWDVSDLRSANVALAPRQVFTQPFQPSRAWLLNPDMSGNVETVKTILSVAAGRQPNLSQVASLNVRPIDDLSALPAADSWISLGSQGKYLLPTGKDGHFDGTLYERDATGTYRRSKLDAAPKTLTAAVLTTDEQHLVLGSRDGTVHCYSAKSPNPREPEANVPLPSAVGVKAIIAAFDAVVVVRLDDGSLWSIDFTTPTEASPTRVSWPDPDLSPKVFSPLAFVPGSNNLLAAVPDPKAPTQNQQVLSLTLGAWLLYGTQTLHVQSTQTPTQAHEERVAGGHPKPAGHHGRPANGGATVYGKHRGPIYAVSFDPSAHNLATAAGDGIVRVWPTDKFAGYPIGQVAHSPEEAKFTELRIDDHPLGSAAYGVTFGTPDSTQQPLVTAGADGSVQFWNMSNPANPLVVAKVSGSSPVLCLDGSSDGSVVVVGRQDGTVTFFDFAKANDYRQQPPSPSGSVGAEVRSIAFDPAPDAKNDLVGLIDSGNEFVLWSRSSGKQLASQKDCCAFAWKPDGSQIVASSPSGVITIFKVSKL